MTLSAKPCIKCGNNTSYSELEANAGICDPCESHRRITSRHNAKNLDIKLPVSAPVTADQKERASANLEAVQKLVGIMGTGLGVSDMLSYIVRNLEPGETLISALHGRVGGDIRMAALTDKRVYEVWISWLKPASKSTRISEISSVEVIPGMFQTAVLLKSKTEVIRYENVWPENAAHFHKMVNKELFASE
jgi:hypothetical protein